MTVTKAIKIIDHLIKHEQFMAKGLIDLAKSWNQKFDCIKQLTQTIADLKKQDIEILGIIKNELETRCRHPKKLRDIDPEGMPYCMGCNRDL